MIKKMWYIFTHSGILAIIKNKILLFGTIWMDLEGIILNEISKRKTSIVYSLTRGI